MTGLFSESLLMHHSLPSLQSFGSQRLSRLRHAIADQAGVALLVHRELEQVLEHADKALFDGLFRWLRGRIGGVLKLRDDATDGIRIPLP